MGIAVDGWLDPSTAPQDGTPVLAWGRAAQVPSDPPRVLAVRYSRGWWTTTHPSMTVKMFAWQPAPIGPRNSP